ncbi:MAG TPA: hypothetical protein VHR97_06980 [Candidatus Baltobacteraceae bacterium]|nr:hypothetical protein [Candidatus Baltobacteraceae bacterium]
MATPRLLAPIAVMALSGCSMQQTPALPVGTAPSAATTMPRSAAATSSPSVSLSPDAVSDDACDAGGGVRATPCKVDFTAANSGPAAVTLTMTGGTTKLAEQDDCSKSGVAVISQQAADQWLVTAGAKHGTCTVHFSDATNGTDAGQALLRIRNDA